MGVSMNWIKEKLSTSHGLLKPNGLLSSRTSKEFSATRNPMQRLKDASPSSGTAQKLLPYLDKGKSGKRNEEAMVHGADSQLVYLSGGRTVPDAPATSGNVHVLSAHLGLVDRTLFVQPKNAKGPGNIAERQHPESIARAAGELQKGEALLIELDGKKGNERTNGHAIAFYKSSGNTLYFFDPNAGVYEIPKPGETAKSKQPARGSGAPAPAEETPERSATNAEAFMTRWMQVYREGDEIAWETPETEWYHAYSAVHAPSSRTASQPAEESTA